MPLRMALLTGAALAVLGSRATADAPKPATDADYQNALVAAIHRLADDGFEAEHLSVILERHPKLVDERVTYRQPRKPLATDHYTALHFAARRGTGEAVKVLLAHKADVNADAGGGWTALHLAAQRGHLDVVKQLVDAGAKVDAKTGGLPARAAPGGPPNAPPVILPAVPALTALDLAKAGKHAAVVEYLEGLK